jgi:hypothetical protein
LQRASGGDGGVEPTDGGNGTILYRQRRRQPVSCLVATFCCPNNNDDGRRSLDVMDRNLLDAHALSTLRLATEPARV